MKILLRLALLLMCAAGGVLGAVQIAARHPKEETAAVEATAGVATAKPPAKPIARALGDDDTDDVDAPQPSESQRFKAAAGERRAAAQAPRFELIRPRTASEYSRTAPQQPDPARAPQYPPQPYGYQQLYAGAPYGYAAPPQYAVPTPYGPAPYYVAQAPGIDPNAANEMLRQLQQNPGGMPNMSGISDMLKGLQSINDARNAQIREMQAQLGGETTPATPAPKTPAAGGPALGAPPEAQPPTLTGPGPAPSGLQESLPTVTQPSTDGKVDLSRAAQIKAYEPKGESINAPGAIAAEGDGRLTINARDVDIRVLLEQLAEQAGMNILAGQSVAGSVTLNLQDVAVEDALDAILKLTRYVVRRDGEFYYIGTAEDFVAMEKAQDRIGTRVYRPNYINSKELSTLITPLLTPQTGKISVTQPASIGIAPDSAQAGGDSMSQQDAIVVQDYENVLTQVDQVVKDLDRRPSQVSIEAMIVSVTLNDMNQFGVDFQVLRDKQNVRLGWGSPRQAPLAGGGQVDPITGANIGQFQFDTGGLKFAFLDDSLGVFLNALESVGDANVIASPKLLCLNKQKAEVLIGQKLGYISTTVTQNFSTQNVEFLEVGAQLRLRPFISSDGLIRLEVHPELSEGSVVVNGGFTLPQKTLTEVTTNVMCPDGCTVILGGLMRENLRSTTTQVPLMGSLPGIGPLFRNKTENVERTEILVLLTPRIVDDGQNAREGAMYTQDAKNMETAKFHRMSPIGKAHLARDYVDRARTARANNNPTLAHRYARLAVHYDPLNRDAVRTLHEINTAGGAVPISQGFAVETNIGEGEAPVVDGEMPAWMLDELGRNEGVAVPEHPVDPGVPGRRTDVVRPEVFRNEKRK
jgi:type IV pilus secretin PilQ/predicted competence protein